MKVHLLPHSPSWGLQFASVKGSLQTIFSTSQTPIISIEHVGSTSIPGLLAKPVLDIDIIVTLEQLPKVRKALSEAGYLDQGECGCPGRWQFRQPGFGAGDAAFGVVGEGEELRRNTYAMIQGCAHLRNHLDVKRVLMEDEGMREEYTSVKRELAKKDYEKMGDYAGAKREILRKILRKAGWMEEDFQALEKPVE